MKNKKELEELDEETTIADMSFLEENRRHFRRREKPQEQPQNNETLSGDNLKAFIHGTLLASLLIGMVYAVVFGIFILILYLYFKSLG